MNVSIFTRLRWFYWRLPLYGRFAVLVAGAVCIGRLLFGPTVEDTKPERPSNRVNQSAYDPVAKWGQAKADAAKKVMAVLQQDCAIYEEGSHLVVEMRMYIDDQDQRSQYVRTIADTDVILHGKPRNIYFYDPSGKQFAQADTLHGVRLIE